MEQQFFRARSVAILFGLMIVCMSVEMISSFINSTSDKSAASPLAFIEVLIALQGVFIFIIFICLPKPFRVLKRWWVSKGSLDVAAFTELEILNKKEQLHQ